MHEEQPPKLDLGDNVLLFGELNHRIRNVFTIIEAAVRQTHSTSVEDYQAKLVARISGLRGLYEMKSRSCEGTVGLAELLEQTTRPYCANGAQVFTAGPDLQLEPKLALPLHLVFHELATNANKYGALSSPSGYVNIEWKIRHVRDAARKLAIVWTEHGGPEVKPPEYRGFGSRLIKRALEGYGGVRLDFSTPGLTCFILIDLDRNRLDSAR